MSGGTGPERSAAAHTRRFVAGRAAACAAALLCAAVLASSGPGRSKGAALRPGDARYAVNPNTATREELCLLPGIGPVLADRILAVRAGVAGRPAFRRAEDLDAVPRIGPATVERLRPWLVFDAEGDASPAPALDSGRPGPEDFPN